MLEIKESENGRLVLAGRLDAAQSEKARRFFEDIQSQITLDCTDLEFISSAGLSELLALRKRVAQTGGTVRLMNVSRDVREVFRYTGLDGFFEFETP
jgi:anti-anti-sigma factor